MAAFKSAIQISTKAREVSEVAFVRPIESAVPADPFGSVFHSCEQDTSSSLNREETRTEGFLEQGLLI